MPIDRTEEHKTAVRLPKGTAERLARIATRTRISQNDLICEAVAFLCDLSEQSLYSARLPDSVVAARALFSHDRRVSAMQSIGGGGGPREQKAPGRNVSREIQNAWGWEGKGTALDRPR